MKKILVANRGEIAARIIRSAREAGYSTVAIYADQDLNSLHVELADEAIPLEGTRSADTYLDAKKIVSAAHRSQADAVHPGYGFLSESADFARAVLSNGLTWIGPRPETIEQLGNKVIAREFARKVGAPLAPGSDSTVADLDEVKDFVDTHGLPIIIKAAHGGGGRGMRIIRTEAEMEEGYASAVREAELAFGRGECFVERFLENPRHVEAQVLADTHGNVVVVGTRDCSLQRRNQKLVEEAPAPFLTPFQRKTIHESAKALCAEAGYVGAGTVEYLLSPDGLLTFLEVNTRLQVEHPVTEETSGVDLVAEQLRIAEGKTLTLTTDPQPHGHSFEFRINAEDPALGFLPTPGPVRLFQPPTGPGIRVETALRSGGEVSSAFDSMFAKLIVTASDRTTALHRARAALAEMRVEGLPTVLPFHREVLEAKDFLAFGGSESFRIHTRWIETEFETCLAESEYLTQATRHREQSMQRIAIEIDGRPAVVGLPCALDRLFPAPASHSSERPSNQQAVGQGVTSPVAGTLVNWHVSTGAIVEPGDTVALVEAMKMESKVTATSSGSFIRETIEPGDSLRVGQLLGRVIDYDND